MVFNKTKNNPLILSFMIIPLVCLYLYKACNWQHARQMREMHW